MMNELSAKSAAAIESQGKGARPPPAQRGSTLADTTAHGRLDELQLFDLLQMQRNGAEPAQIAAAARKFGAKEGDPALASALEQLRAPVILMDHAGNKTGLWSAPQLGEFASDKRR